MHDYLNEYKTLHTENPSYGLGGGLYFEEICLIIDELNPKVILDYGCGKGTLIEYLKRKYPNIDFYGYDPAVKDFEILPIKKADLVLNTDVLEHIPENFLPNVLEEIAQISENVFFGLHHALASTILPNGKNAHCTVKPPIWYYKIFLRYWKTPYPLKGCFPELSSMITFSPSISFLRKYEELIIQKSNLNFFTNIINKKNTELSINLDKKVIPYKLGRLISCFIFKRKNRHRFMEKYVKPKN